MSEGISQKKSRLHELEKSAHVDSPSGNLSTSTYQPGAQRYLQNAELHARDVPGLSRNSLPCVAAALATKETLSTNVHPMPGISALRKAPRLCRSLSLSYMSVRVRVSEFMYRSGLCSSLPPVASPISLCLEFRSISAHKSDGQCYGPALSTCLMAWNSIPPKLLQASTLYKASLVLPVIFGRFSLMLESNGKVLISFPPFMLLHPRHRRRRFHLAPTLTFKNLRQRLDVGDLCFPSRLICFADLQVALPCNKPCISIASCRHG